VVALVAVIATPIGLLVGTTAGYFGGWVDTVLMRLTDIFLAFPRLILALAFVAALGPGIENAIIAIAITSWPPYARLARAETLTIRDSDFINAIRLQGARPAGEEAVRWEGRDAYGRAVAPGVYFLRARVPGETVSQRVIWLGP
jgi:peptide/nickel transport system permease protein